ncbi:MAG: SIMPL domain-containing protein [Acidimicrobiales bacterium]
MIEQPWGVTAHGEGSIQVEPDYAVLRVAVNRIDQSPKMSLEDVQNAVSAVRHSLRAHQIPDAQITSSRISVRTAWEMHRGERTLLGHQARVEFSVRVTQLELVVPALVDAIDAGADEVIEIAYGSSRADELRSEAREQAVAAAHAKARLYAEAANVRLGAVVHIEDVEPGRAGLGSGGPGLGGWQAAGDAVDTARDLAPGRVTVRAAVVLGFAIIR